jgi:hypothetical protein
MAVFPVVFCIALAGCKSSGEKNSIPASVVQNPNSATGKGDTESLPAFQFKDEEHDFGKVIEGEIVTYAFRFTNTGKSDLVISNVSTSCGCTVTKFPQDPIPPKSDGYIEVTFNSEGRGGFQNKTITVLANTQPNEKVLRITAQVIKPDLTQ